MPTDPLTVVRDRIADPSSGPLIAELVAAELGPIAAALQADEISPQSPYSDEEFVRRATSLAAATDRLARYSALAGRWAPIETARIWPSVLAELLGVRDRGNGLQAWLQLLVYPALLVEYAFGLGASIGRRWESLAAILTAETPAETDGWLASVTQLHPATIHSQFAVKLKGANSRWPLSDHLLNRSRSWFAETVPSDALYEREFDRFEVLLCLVYYDIARGDFEDARSPVGRFARRGFWTEAAHQELIDAARRGDTAATLLGRLAHGDPERATATIAAFDRYVRKVLGQVW